MWEGLYVHSLTLPLCPVVWQVVLHYGFKLCQQASLQHFTGLARYGKLYLKCVLYCLEAPQMSKATAGLHHHLCAITSETHLQSKEKITRLKNQLPFGCKKKIKTKSKSRISPQLKEKGETHPLLPSPQSIFHTQTITFASALQTGSGSSICIKETQHTWSGPFQKSASRVLSPAPRQRWCLLSSQK